MLKIKKFKEPQNEKKSKEELERIRAEYYKFAELLVDYYILWLTLKK